MIVHFRLRHSISDSFQETEREANLVLRYTPTLKRSWQINAME